MASVISDMSKKFFQIFISVVAVVVIGAIGYFYYQSLHAEGLLGPGIINGIAVSNITDTSATVSWNTSTAVDSLAYDAYLIGEPHLLSYSSPLVQDATVSTSHQLTLTGLKPCYQYQYWVGFHDAGLPSNSYWTSQGSWYLQTTGCPAGATINKFVGAGMNPTTFSDGSLSMVGSGVTQAKVSFPIADIPPTGYGIYIAQYNKNIGAITNVQNAVGNNSYRIDLLNDMSNWSGKSGQLVHTVSQPATVTLSYSGATVSDPSALEMVRSDDSSSWTVLSGCTTDSVAKTVSCPTSNFSTFALVTEATAPVVTPPAATSSSSSSSTSTTTKKTTTRKATTTTAPATATPVATDTTAAEPVTTDQTATDTTTPEVVYTGTLVAKVVDPAGNAVSGATISLSGITGSRTSDSDGIVVFSGVPSGSYTLTADSANYIGTKDVTITNDGTITNVIFQLTSRATGMTTTTKVIIGVGIAVLLGLIILVLIRRRNNSQPTFSRGV